MAPATRGLIDKGLTRLDAALRPPRLFFTEAGIVALRAMMSERRLANPEKFGHIRRELGINPPEPA
jgi:hypothetical protein